MDSRPSLIAINTAIPWVLAGSLLASPAAQANGHPAAASPCAGIRPALEILHPNAQFGDVYQHRVIQSEFKIFNSGDRPIEVREVVAVSSDATVGVEPPLIPAGGKAVARVRQSMAERLGRTAFRYAILTDEPCVERYRFTLSGFVQSAYDPERATLDFGVVARDVGGSTRAELYCREVESLRILAIEGAPPYLELEVSERIGVAAEGVAVRAEIAPGAPLGLRTGKLRLRTNVAHQPDYVVTFRAAVYGNLIASENPIDLGLARAHEPMAKTIRLERRDLKPLSISRIEDSGNILRWELLACSETPTDSPSCALLHVWRPPTDPSELTQTFTLQGTLTIHAQGQHEPLPLQYQGWVVPSGTEIRQLAIPEAPISGAGEPP